MKGLPLLNLSELPQLGGGGSKSTEAEAQTLARLYVPFLGIATSSRIRFVYYFEIAPLRAATL